jgi:hypothetical protein
MQSIGAGENQLTKNIVGMVRNELPFAYLPYQYLSFIAKEMIG